MHTTICWSVVSNLASTDEAQKVDLSIRSKFVSKLAILVAYCTASTGAMPLTLYSLPVLISLQR